MLYFLLFLAAMGVGFIWHVRRHFTQITPKFRVDERHGGLTVRRYPKMVVAEVRVSGSASLALRTASAQLDRYYREEKIARFALPLLAEKVDAADPIWAMSAVLPMELEAAPAPRNKSIQVGLAHLRPHPWDWSTPPSPLVLSHGFKCAQAQGLPTSIIPPMPSLPSKLILPTPICSSRRFRPIARSHASSTGQCSRMSF